jgi:hypothetical protein
MCTSDWDKAADDFQAALAKKWPHWRRIQQRG